MANDVVMPRLGWTMEVGRVVEWLKGDGDPVRAGEPIFSVESDKAITEIEALDSGVLRIPPDSPPPGEEVPVGARLAYIVAPGESPPFRETGEDVRSEPPTQPDDAPPGHAPVAGAAPTPARRNRHGAPAISPRARRAAAELGLDWTVITGSGSTGRIVERDVRLAATAVPTLVPAARPRATPLVRRMAEENGLDLGGVAATAPTGRVTRADVRAAVQAAAPSAAGATLPSTGDEGAPMGQIRRIVAQRMAESARTVAPVTLTTDADATELASIRDHLKAELASADEPVPSFTDFLVRLVALALVEHPALNASLVDDRIAQYADVHVGIAVDTERGLVVPVVRDAHRRSVHEIAAESARLVAAARAGTIAADDLRGGTFTVSNLGMFDIDAFTPIVNLPECAVLGLGRVVARPVVIDEAAEAVAVRKMLALSLTFDHRLVDGAPAARFLQRVKKMVERPYVWLTR